MCEGFGERAAVMLAQPVLKLRKGGELAIRLNHGPLAVHPLGLDRVEPRTPFLLVAPALLALGWFGSEPAEAPAEAVVVAGTAPGFTSGQELRGGSITVPGGTNSSSSSGPGSS